MTHSTDQLIRSCSYCFRTRVSFWTRVCQCLWMFVCVCLITNQRIMADFQFDLPWLMTIMDRAYCILLMLLFFYTCRNLAPLLPLYLVLNFLYIHSFFFVWLANVWSLWMFASMWSYIHWSVWMDTFNPMNGHWRTSMRQLRAIEQTTNS